MAEPDFERRLERLFADAPAFADDDAFADRIAQRLDRGWTARRWLIGAAGVTGGVVGASQMVVSGVFHRMESAGTSARALSTGLTQTAPAQWISTLPSGGVVVWIAVAVAIVMIGFVLTRVIEEI
ncbi:hypothetical protein LJR225_000703 [Phenylobacterium sp. LjRoot225]|uniref:hypothetical protein n=1 Tax=Phenylobacterium sp. LjRoot225 TaxID=3342285 RepID=UPI003ECF51A7